MSHVTRSGKVVTPTLMKSRLPWLHSSRDSVLSRAALSALQSQRSTYHSTYSCRSIVFKSFVASHNQFLQTIVLPDSVKESFIKSTALEARDPYEQYFEIARDMGKNLNKCMPLSIRNRCAEMGLWNKPQVMLLKNCPVSIHPGKTPEEDKHNPKKGFLDELFLLGLMNILYSTPYHDRHGKYGEVIGQVIAKKGSENELSSRGSKLRFNFHTEIVQVEQPIDILTLFCIKGDPKAATEIASVDAFVKDLPQWVIEGMLKPVFEMRAGPTWVDKSGQNFPILEPDPAGGFFVRFNSDLGNRVVGKTSEALRVLEYLGKHLENGFEFTPIVLEKGDCLVIKNRKSFHARNAYDPSTLWEERRWLLRGYSRLNWPQLFHKFCLSQINI